MQSKRYWLTSAIAALVILAGHSAYASDPTIGSFLRQHAFGTLYVDSTHHDVPELNGFPAPNTNAVASDREEARIHEVLHADSAAFGRFHGGPPNASDGIVAADPARHIVVVEQNPKGSGGEQLSVMRYDSPLPHSIPAHAMPELLIAGIGIGSPASDVLHRFGQPYATATSGGAGSAIGATVRHRYPNASWLQKVPPDGVYFYVGPVPKKAQTCMRSFAIVITKQIVVGIRESVEC